MWMVSRVGNQCRYWYYLSFEHDSQPQWAGLTRQDMSRARAKAKRMLAKGPGPPIPGGKPRANRVGPRMRATRRYRRAKRRGELIQPPAVAPPMEEAPLVPSPVPKVRYKPPKPPAAPTADTNPPGARGQPVRHLLAESEGIPL
jgi:hypothetical protein